MVMPSPRRFPPPWSVEMRPAPLLPCTSSLRRSHSGEGRYASFARSRFERAQRIEDLGCSDQSYIAGQRSLGRSAIRDFGLSQKLRPLSSNSRPKTHRARSSASKCDGRAAFDGPQCVRILPLSHKAVRFTIGCRKYRHGTKTFEETLAIWKSSSGHNANLLKPNVTRMGLASASQDGTTYWALILAAQPKPPQSNVRVLSIFPPIILFGVGTP